APQHPENLPRSDEVRRPHATGKVGKRSAQIGDLPEGEGDRDRLSQLGVVIDGREQIEQVVLELRQVFEDVPTTGVEEVDDPHVVVRVYQDVGRVEIAVHVRHEVVVLRGERGACEELVVEAADVRQLESAGEVDHRAGRGRHHGCDG